MKSPVAIALVALLAFAAPGECGERGELSHWIFTPEHVEDGKVKDHAGNQPVLLSASSRVISEPGSGALLFARSGDRALIATSLRRARLPKKAFTVEAWVSIDEAQSWGGIVGAIQDNGSFEKGWLLGYRGDRFCFALATEGADDGDGKLTYLTGNSAFGLGRWFHVAGVYDGAEMQLFVNGRREASSSEQSGAILYPRRAVYCIGAYEDDNENYPLRGLVGEVRVWKRALEEEALAAHHLAWRCTLPEPETPGLPRELGRWRPESSETEPEPGPGPGPGPGPAARRFDGGRESARVELSAEAVGARFSVEATVLAEDPRSSGAVAAAGDPASWVLGCGSGRFRFGVRGAGEDAPSWARAGVGYEAFRWYHLVGTFDGALTRLYVNGEPAGFSRGAIGPLDSLPATIELGGWRDALGRHAFAGRLHDLRLWDRELTEAEVRGRFASMSEVFPDPLALDVGPVVRFRGHGRAEISFSTASPLKTAIELSRPGEAPRRLGGGGLRRDHVALAGELEPETIYAYRVLAEDGAGARFASRSFFLDTSFDYEPPAPPARPTAWPEDEETPFYREAALAILEECPVRRGWCLVLDADRGRLAGELALHSQLKIIAVESDPEERQAAREALASAGLYGVRVSVHEDLPGALPYGDWFANLIVSGGMLRGERPAHDFAEALRCLRPAGGVAVFGQSASAPRPTWTAKSLRAWSASAATENTRIVESESFTWLVEKRAALEGSGEWSHQYGDAANTACSGDELVTGELTVQWFGRPGPRPMLDRGARNPAPLSAGGRMYIQGDRRLFGLDAYNGAILWTLEIPDLRRSNMPRDCSNMAADADALYVAIEDRCWRVDGQSGEISRFYELPGAPALEGERAWGYLARAGDLLLGSEGQAAATYRGAEGEWYDGTSAAEVRPVLSRRLFALDLETGEPRWSHESGQLVNPTLTVADGRVYFVEDRAARPRNLADGRLAELTGEHQYLVALDLASGEKVWERAFDFRSLSRVMYLQVRGEVLLVSGASDRYHLFAFDTSDAKSLWEHHPPFERDHHGGAIQHPVLLDDQLLLDRSALELATGRVLREDLPSRRGCGTLSASARNVFFRDYSHGMWDADTGERRDLLGLRSSCWLGMIPAGGLLLTPEGSSGCSCMTPMVQTSAAFRPVGD